jgi:ADP-ribose pyrophosphatase YjhB (NUDIX family)
VETIWRRSARAILLDDEARLVLIRRTKPGRPPWWTTVGGGVEPGDASVEAALYRELREELGAEVTGARQVHLFSSPAREGGIAIAHFFVARLVRMDLSRRTGPEFDDPARGAYDPDWFSLYDGALSEIDLRPPELKDFILGNREALLTEAGLLSR